MNTFISLTAKALAAYHKSQPTINDRITAHFRDLPHKLEPGKTYRVGIAANPVFTSSPSHPR